MAIVSYGYPPSVGADGEIWARFSTQAFGRRYSALTHADFRVTAATSGTTRRVNIAAGWMAGQGILVHNTTNTFLDLDAPAGTSQWLCVVLKRWQGGGDDESTLGVIAGTSSRLVPTLVHDPGTNDEQALALCRVSSSSGLVQEVIDLRAISFEAGGFYVCHTPEAMDLLNDMTGVDVYRTDTKSFHKRIISASGALSWKNMGNPDARLTGAAAIDAVGPGWLVQDSCRMDRTGKDRKFVLELNRSSGPNGGSFTSDGSGRISDVLLAELHSDDNPPSGVVIPLVGRVRDESGSNGTSGCFGHITADGTVYLNSMLPNVTFSSGDQLILTGGWCTA